MTVVGSNLESKEIGLSIGLSGTHYNTKIDTETGYLTLKSTDVDSFGNPVYADEGYWISDVINLGDKFADFDKFFTTETVNGTSSFSVQTRTSDNGYDWSEWVAIAMDGAIQSDTKQYIQVRIDLYAGFVNDIFIINKNEYTENNKYTENITIEEEYYAVPTLTSSTSTTGFSFSETYYSATYPNWKAFDENDSTDYLTASGTITGFLGYCFTNKTSIKGYKLKSSATSSRVNAMPKNWVIEGSSNTTDGIDGNWDVIDERTNQTWSTVKKEVVYEINGISKKYNAFRIKWTENNGYANYTAISSLNFLVPKKDILKLKREYEFDMTLDETWTKEGSLHRKLIKRDDWVRIDKLNILEKIGGEENEK